MYQSCMATPAHTSHVLLDGWCDDECSWSHWHDLDAVGDDCVIQMLLVTILMLWVLSRLFKADNVVIA